MQEVNESGMGVQYDRVMEVAVPRRARDEVFAIEEVAKKGRGP